LSSGSLTFECAQLHCSPRFYRKVSIQPFSESLKASSFQQVQSPLWCTLLNLMLALHRAMFGWLSLVVALNSGLMILHQNKTKGRWRTQLMSSPPSSKNEAENEISSYQNNDINHILL
jgi:hypothetical protein